MEQGVASVSVRKALLEYFLLENRLLETKYAELDRDSKFVPDNGMIAVQNSEEISGMVLRT